MVIDLDDKDVSVGLSGDTQERIALRLIGRVNDSYYEYRNRRPVYGLDGVCERVTSPLPHGCWDHGSRSPYAKFGDERWCNACIAYAALNGTLPRPVLLIEGSVA